MIICILQSVSSGVWAPQALAFTAGTEAKPECPAVNRPARTQCAAWDRVHFMEFAWCLFLVIYLHVIAISGHVHKLHRVWLALLYMVRHDLR